MNTNHTAKYISHYPAVTGEARIIASGGVIAYPTEAVWGLGCDPFNPRAVNKILALKQRSVAKGLILAAADIGQLEPFLTNISAEQRQQLETSWPGPVTWLVPNNGLIPHWISGDFSSVALRVSDHPYVQQLCRAYGGPIVSTSANPQGKPAPKHRWQVCRYFNQLGNDGLLDRVVKGAVGKRLEPSQIRDIVTGDVLR